MTATITALDRLDAALAPGAGVVALVAFVCAFIALALRPRPFLGLPTAVVVTPCLGLFMGFVGSQLLITHLVVNEGREVLDRLLIAPVIGVVVDGKTLSNPAPLVSALKGMDNVRPDHSRPLAGVPILVVTRRGSAALRLGRDEKDPSNYWVFSEALHLTRLNQIGHIHYEGPLTGKPANRSR